MAYLGRRGALAPVTAADIPDNSITTAKIVDGAVTTADIAYLGDSAGQDLTGTYSDSRVYLSGRIGSAPNDYNYRLTGNVTVTGHLALGSVADADVVITNDSSARTIDGSGTIESGELLSSKETDLTDMTGTLANSVQDNVTRLGTVTTGTFNGTLDSTTFSGDAGQRTAKAWCNFIGTGTPSIRTSFNCSSLTDVDVGRWEVNYATPMSSQYHAPVSAQGGSVVHVMVVNEDQNAGAGKCEVGNYRWDTGAYNDTGSVYVIVFGD